MKLLRILAGALICAFFLTYAVAFIAIICDSDSHVVSFLSLAWLILCGVSFFIIVEPHHGNYLPPTFKQPKP